MARRRRRWIRVTIHCARRECQRLATDVGIDDNRRAGRKVVGRRRSPPPQERRRSSSESADPCPSLGSSNDGRKPPTSASVSIPLQCVETCPSSSTCAAPALLHRNGAASKWVAHLDPSHGRDRHLPRHRVVLVTDPRDTLHNSPAPPAGSGRDWRERRMSQKMDALAIAALPSMTCSRHERVPRRRHCLLRHLPRQPRPWP